MIGRIGWIGRIGKIGRVGRIAKIGRIGRDGNIVGIGRIAGKFETKTYLMICKNNNVEHQAIWFGFVEAKHKPILCSIALNKYPTGLPISLSIARPEKITKKLDNSFQSNSNLDNVNIT